MNERLTRIFILEDQPAEAELTKRAVLKYAPNALFTIANSEAEFLDKITWSTYEIVLADYNLPGYNGLDAMLWLKEHLPDLPFIFVTGTLNNEEKVAHAILKGADGYVLKDNLSVLPATIDNILSRAAEKRIQQKIKQKKSMDRSLKLRKVQALLQRAQDFPDKDQINGLLEEVLAVSE